MKSGFLITLEGPEGSGKSTHSTLLVPYLEERGLRVLKTRQPGGSTLGTGLRRLLLDTQIAVDPLAELLIYQADRAQHIAEVMRPALKAGTVVLCDRYTDSTMAYQGYGRGLDLKIISGLNRLATGGLEPALTIVLDVEPRRGLRQAEKYKKRLDRLEKAGLAFHRRVRKGFLTLAAKEPRRFRVVRQQSETHDTQALVRAAIDDFLAKRRA